MHEGFFKIFFFLNLVIRKFSGLLDIFFFPKLLMSIYTIQSLTKVYRYRYTYLKTACQKAKVKVTKNDTDTTLTSQKTPYFLLISVLFLNTCFVLKTLLKFHQSIPVIEFQESTLPKSFIH